MTRQNILITGASSGLGKGMAIEFAKMGRNLALCARRVERLEELKQELLAINPDIKIFIPWFAAKDEVYLEVTLLATFSSSVHE